MIVFEVIGVMTVLVFAAYLTMYLYMQLWLIFKNQRKIKCLCRHEYMIDRKWYGNKFEDLDLKCRKCGKRKKLRIWKQEEEENERT